jgi:hypothetical protein
MQVTQVEVQETLLTADALFFILKNNCIYLFN